MTELPNISPALWRDDETKIWSGVSQSPRDDESFEIVESTNVVTRIT